MIQLRNEAAADAPKPTIRRDRHLELTGHERYTEKWERHRKR